MTGLGNELINFMNEEEKILAKYKTPAKKFFLGGMGFKGAHGITSSENGYPPFALLNIKNALLKPDESDALAIAVNDVVSTSSTLLKLTLPAILSVI